MFEDLIENSLVLVSSEGPQIDPEGYSEDLSLEYLGFLEKEANQAFFVNDTESRLDAANICTTAAKKWLIYALKEKSQSAAIYQKIIRFYTTSTTQYYEYLLATQGSDISADIYKKYFSQQSMLLASQFNSTAEPSELLEKVLRYMSKIAEIAVRKHGQDIVCSLILKAITGVKSPVVAVHLYKLAYDYLDSDSYSADNPSALVINNYHSVLQGLCVNNNALTDNDAGIEEIEDILESESEAISEREMALHSQGFAVPDMEYAGEQEKPKKSTLRSRFQ